MVSAILEDDALDDVGDVLATIGRRLQRLVNLFPLYDRDRIFFFAEQAHQRAAQDRVGDVLEAVDLDAVLEDQVLFTEIADAGDGAQDVRLTLTATR